MLVLHKLRKYTYRCISKYANRDKEYLLNNDMIFYNKENDYFWDEKILTLYNHTKPFCRLTTIDSKERTYFSFFVPKIMGPRISTNYIMSHDNMYELRVFIGTYSFKLL